jgi:hypothetical protein
MAPPPLGSDTLRAATPKFSYCAWFTSRRLRDVTLFHPSPAATRASGQARTTLRRLLQMTYRFPWRPDEYQAIDIVEVAGQQPVGHGAGLSPAYGQAL